MAPLYQHFNKQKSSPLMMVGNYQLITQSDVYFQQQGTNILLGNNALNVPGGQYANNAVWLQNVTTGAKTVTIKYYTPNLIGGWIGIVFRDSSVGKSNGIFAIQTTSAGYGIRRIGFLDPPGGYISYVHDLSRTWATNTSYWLRLIDDGTNITGQYSNDGITFTTYTTYSRAAVQVTNPNQFGLWLVPGWSSTLGGQQIIIQEVTVT